MANETILIIDNDAETMQKIMSTLETESYLVFTASGKDAGITMAKDVSPSLIFINIGMSGASGLEICKAIHNAETLGSVPIVVIAPHGEGIDSLDAALYGIVDFLERSFSPEELISRTKNVIAMKSVEAQHVEEEIELEKEPMSIENRDTAYMPAKSKRIVKRNWLFAPAIILVLIIIGAAGIIHYRGLWHKAIVQIPVAVKPSKPVQQKAVKIDEPASEQKPQQALEDSKPLPQPAEAKPEGTVIYSVQIGEFKNESNAMSMAEQYKERGYDAFTHKKTTKNKGIRYIVLIGNFENKKEAAELAKSIRAKEKFNVIIFHRQV